MPDASQHAAAPDTEPPLPPNVSAAARNAQHGDTLAPILVTAAEAAHLMREPAATRPACLTADCPGDARYTAPGRGHRPGCTYPAAADTAPPYAVPAEPNAHVYDVPMPRPVIDALTARLDALEERARADDAHLLNPEGGALCGTPLAPGMRVAVEREHATCQDCGSLADAGALVAQDPQLDPSDADEALAVLVQRAAREGARAAIQADEWHRYAGACPSGDDPDARDPECDACQTLAEALGETLPGANPAPQADTPETGETLAEHIGAALADAIDQAEDATILTGEPDPETSPLAAHIDAQQTAAHGPWHYAAVPRAHRTACGREARDVGWRGSDRPDLTTCDACRTTPAWQAASAAPQADEPELVEDEDEAPYPPHVQDALRALHAPYATLLDFTVWSENLAPVLLDLLPDPALDDDLRETINVALAEAYAAETARLDHHHVIGCSHDYEVPQLRGLLSQVDGITSDDPEPSETAPQAESAQDPAEAATAAYRARREADAYTKGHADGMREAYVGADDDPGDPACVATPGQWLRRLFDQPAKERLRIAEALQRSGRMARACFEGGHDRIADDLRNLHNRHMHRGEQLREARDRAAALERELASAQTALLAAAQTSRDVRRRAAVAAWDAAADDLAPANPATAAALRVANPYREAPADQAETPPEADQSVPMIDRKGNQ